MHSLACMEHQDWDGTLHKIREGGGKPATGKSSTVDDGNVGQCWLTSSDWILDKIHSKFAFEAMCWERSKIPYDIWRAGDANSNLIETVHQGNASVCITV